MRRLHTSPAGSRMRSTAGAPRRLAWLAALWLLVLQFGAAQAQVSVSRVEYFLDADPGFGAATTVPATAAPDLTNLSFGVDLSSISRGFHSMGVRSRDANNVWSLTTRRAFYYESASVSAVNINKAEYFVDADPGFGAATDIPLTAGLEVSGLAFSVDLSSLNTGFHNLGIRTRDANGNWSLTSRRSFYYELASALPLANIDRIEYFVDNDPGFGAATAATGYTSLTDVSGVAFSLNLASLSTGFHTLGIRSRDASGNWSLTSRRGFYYEPAVAVAQRNITKVEYYLDTDPGFGSATDITPSNAGPDVSGISFSMNLSSLSTGFHTLNVRSKDDQNQWSLTNRRAFYYEPLPAALADITRVEYYFDADPGFGSGTSVAVTPGPDLAGVGVLADASALADGQHRLFIRSQDSNGKWSLVSNRSFLKNGCGSSTNVAAGLPSANYQFGGNYYGGSAEAAFNNPAGSSSNYGSYNGGFIQADFGAANLQSISDLRLRLVPQSNTTLTMQIFTSPNGSSFALADTYTASLAANTTYDIARTLPTVVSGVRAIRVVFGAAPNAAMSVTGAGAYFFNCSGPAITSFSPAGGPAGTVVNIVGANLSGVTSVSFNGTAVPVAQITNNTATGLTVVAPTGGTSGQICLTTPAGSTCSAQSYQYPPTIVTGTVSLTAFCSNRYITVPFTTNLSGYGSGNQFGFQLSDANGVFAANSRIYNQNVSVNANGGTITDSIAFRQAPGTGYRVRVVSTNPAIVGSPNGTNLTIYTTPVATAAATPQTVAFGGSTTLTAGPAAQSSYQWYVRYLNNSTAYVGSGASLTLNNLTVSQSGKYFVFVTNATGCQDSASVNVQVNPSAQPVIAIAQFGGTYCAGASSLSFSYTVQGNSFPSGNTISAELSDASGSFASPTTLGTVPFVGQGNGFFNVAIPAGTLQGSGYRLRLVASTAFVSTPATNGTNLTINAAPVAVASSNSPVAYGGTIQLTAQGAGPGASYQWYGPGFFSTQQNPTISNATTGSNQGTYQLIVTLNGCQSTTTTNVVVSPSSAPILTMSAFGGGPLCAGSTTLNIGFSVTGNSFASGNQIQAQLSDASGGFGAPTVIGAVAFAGQGSGTLGVSIPAGIPAGSGYRIRLVGTNPGVPSQTDNGSNLSINAAPVATIVANNSPVAYSGIVTLTAQAVSGASYVWSVPGVGNVSTGTSPTLNLNNATPSNSGTYTLTVLLNGCSNTTTASVTVLPAGQPIVAIAQFGATICAGASLNVGFSVSGANLSGTLTAQLSDDNGSFASPVNIGSVAFNGQGGGSISATIPVNTVQGGLYRIRLQASVAATYNPANNGTNISISATPVAVAGSNSPVPAGGTITLTAQTTLPGTVYSWTGPNGFSATNQQNPTINNATAANAGTYVLTTTLAGCSTQSSTVVSVGAALASISTGSFGGTFCPGSVVSVPFTATGFVGGNVFTAQLSDASGSFASATSIGTVSGTASGSIAAQIPVGAPAGTAYRIRVVGSSPATTSSNDNGSNLVVGPITYTWTGAAGNTNWFDALNWSCGQVPTSTSVVIIPSGVSFYPVITGTTAVALNLTVQTGATFTVNGTFNLYGNVTMSGTMTASSTSSWYFAGPGAQYVYGTSAFNVGNVYINTGSILNLSGGFVNVSGNWTNNGGFVGGVAYNVYFTGLGGTQIIGGTSVSTFYNVGVASGAVVNLGINTVFLNNLQVNGTFSGAGYGVVFGSTTVVQTIGGTGNTTFYGVTINNTIGVNLVSNITVLGNWINNGQFTAGTYSVIFAGTVAQIIGGTQVTNFYNVTFNNLLSVTLHQNIYVLGSFNNTGVFYGYYLTGSVTNGFFVRFGGSVAQVINANATTYFYHFYVDNAAGVSLATNIYIAGNYYLYAGSFVPSTYTVYFNGVGGYVQTVGGYTNLSFYGWNIVSGATVRLLQNVTWLGGFQNFGTFHGYNLVGGVYTGYTCLFNGTGAQVIGGTGVYEFWHVTWNNVAGITLNTNISVWGNWLNNGGYLANGYLVNFMGNVAQLIGGSVNTIFHHITISNLVSVTLNQPIVVLGNWAGTGVFFGNTYLVSFNGTVAQTILTGIDTRFFNVLFNNATSVTLLSNVYLNGNWTNNGGFVAGGYGVYFSGLALQLIGGTALSTFHHLTVVAGAQVQLNQAIHVTGNWTNNNVFLHNNLNVTFAGNGAQVVGGSAITNFYGVIFTNTGTVTLGNDIRVAGVWTNNGVFAPAAYTVYFNGAVAQLIGGSSISTFFGLNIVNTVGVSLSGPIFIKGNLVNDGLFSCANYLVTFNGTALQTIGGLSTTIFGNITCNNAVGVGLAQNIRVRGDFLNSAIFTAGGYIVYFDGSIAQNITSTGTLTFHDVVFANTLGVTLQNNIFLTGNWVNNGGFLANGHLVTFSGTVLQTIGGTVATTFHHIAFLTGATVRQLLGLTILGNWTNGGVFQHNNLLVYFNGTALQTIGGTALTTFYDITMNNAVNVSLGFDIDVVRHFVNQGAFCGCGHKVRFNGTVPQTITCTSGNTHFHDITFANLQGVTLLDGIYVSGNWVNNGGYLANGKLVVFDGTALQTIGGSVVSAFYHWQNTNNSTAGVTLLSNVTYTGNWTNNGKYCGCGFLSLFNGTTAQSLTCTTSNSNFHHLTLANTSAGGVTLTGNINVSGNWLQSSNWNPQTYTVFFNGTAGQTIGIGGSILLAQFHHLTISNTATAGVTLNCGLGLTGNWTNNGVFFAGLNTVFANGTGTLQTFGGSAPTTFYNWTIQNPAGASCTGTGGTATTPALGLLHVLTMATGGGNLACDGKLTLISNASGTGMVVNQPNGGICTGVATMERFITGLGSNGYRHYSSPMKLSGNGIVTNMQEFADDLPVFELNPQYNTIGNAASPFPTVFKYDESRLTAARPTFDDGFMVPTATEALEPLRGYTAQTAPTTTVDISGQLQNGPVSYNLTRGSLANSGWHLLGNPYPAPMDWDVARSTSGMLSGVADALYVFQPSGQYTGTYKAYVNGIGQNGGSKDLAAMQGFFVRATAPTAAVNFTNAVRATSYLSPGFDRQTTTSTVRPVVRLQARNVANGTADETVIYFEPAAGLGFSAQHDAYKMQLNGNGRPSLWTQSGTEYFAINGLPQLATAPVIPLGVKVSVDGAHRLVLNGLADVPAGTQVWLEDRVLNRRQNLAQDSAYAFTMLASFNGPRFYLNFVAGAPLAVTTGKLDLRTAIYPNPTTGKATLELAGLREQGAVQVDVVNVLGQTVRHLSVRPKLGFLLETLDLRELPTGVYTVRIHAQEGTVVKRLVKE